MKMALHARGWLVSGASVVALVGAAPALAQTAAPPAPPAPPPAAQPADAGQVGQVVVTAEKRTTLLQKVPVAVSVFTGKQRDIIGINSVQDVTNFSPGFTYDTTTVHAYIRGVGRQSFSVADDSRVASYEDGFFVYSPYNLDHSSLFLSNEQIERGPQNVGGRNAAAGSIDMISVRPTDTPYAEVRAYGGSYDSWGVEGAVSGPVAPWLNVRVAGYEHDQEQGYFKNVIAGLPSEQDRNNEWYLEGQADAKLGPNADLWLKAYDSGWNNEGDAGARNFYENGSWDETNLTDANFGAGSLFVNPNYGYAALPGAARNAALAAVGPGLVPIAVQLYNPNVFDNPSATNPDNFASPLARKVTLNQYANFSSIFTYHFPTFDFKYVGGVQGYDYYLTFNGGGAQRPDTDVESFTMPGSAFSGATITALNTGFGGGAFPGCAACGAGGTPLPAAVPLPAPSLLQINPLVFSTYREKDIWTDHDFSLQSTDDSPFQWIVGGFYYFQHYYQPSTASAPNQPQLSNPLYVPPSTLLVGGTSFVGFGAGVPAPPNPNNYIYYLMYDMTTQSEAGYAQVSYKFNDQFKLTASFRYTDDQKFGVEASRYTYFESALIDGYSNLLGAATPALDITPTAFCPSGVPAHCNSGPLAPGVKTLGVINPTTGVLSRQLSATSSAPTGGVNLEYTPNPDTFLYARYNRGYEDMTFNAGYNSANPEVSPEYINAYEVGYKQNVGRTLSFDMAAYYYDYINLQLPISVFAGGLVQTAFIDVPKSVSEGFEFEGQWTPIEHLLISGSYSYDYTSILTGCSGTVTGGTLTPGAGALCNIDTNDPDAVEPNAKPFPGQALNGGVYQSVKGDPLPDAPKNKVAVNVAYTIPLDANSLTLSVSYVWRDVQNGTVFNEYYDNAPSWSDWDFRAIWQGDHGRYQVTAWVKNIFNTIQYSVGSAGTGLYGNTNSIANPTKGLYETNIFGINPPRTFGVEVRYKFF
jgi:iron complex outermembrane recepter protein